jgi:hypothetical protein
MISHLRLDRVFADFAAAAKCLDGQEVLVRARPDHPSTTQPNATRLPPPTQTQTTSTFPSATDPLLPLRATVQFCAVEYLQSIIFPHCLYVPDAATVVAASSNTTTAVGPLSRLPASVTRQHAISPVTLPVYGTIDERLGSCQAPKSYHRKFSSSVTRRH